MISPFQSVYFLCLFMAICMTLYILNCIEVNCKYFLNNSLMKLVF